MATNANKNTTETNVNPETGEELKSYQKMNGKDVVSKYKYLEGHPRQYRFDAKDLQSMYDDANWSGCATRDGEQYYKSQILQMANEQGIKLSYNCPA